MLVGKQTPRKNVQLVNPPSENTTTDLSLHLIDLGSGVHGCLIDSKIVTTVIDL